MRNLLNITVNNVIVKLNEKYSKNTIIDHFFIIIINFFFTPKLKLLNSKVSKTRLRHLLGEMHLVLYSTARSANEFFEIH